MTTTESKLLTADDLLRLDAEGVRGELIRGVLCETMAAGQEHGEIAMRLGAALLGFIEPRGLGRVMGSDSGVWLERDPDTVREPDIAFFSAAKVPPGVRVTGYSEMVPDLVVEIVSPSDSRREVHDKAHMWLSHGVRLVWVVHPETRTVDVHRPDTSHPANRVTLVFSPETRTVDVHRPDHAVATLGDQDSLDGLDVLPGFSCEVSAVFGPSATEAHPGQ